MTNLREVSASLKPTIDDADATMRKIGKVADDADAFVNGDGLSQLSGLMSEARRLVGTLNKFSEQINRSPTTILFGDRRKGYDPNGK